MAKKQIEQTEIEAPYELPEGWKWCRQNEVCKLTDGEKLTGVDYPYLEVKYLRGNKNKEIVSSGKFIKQGTIVILVDGENSGEVFTVPEDGFMGSTFKSLSIQNVDENYLQFFISTKKDLYRNNKKGSAIPHLNKELFFNMPFPLPPTLEEQQRIVNRIETLFAKLDQAKEKAQNVVDTFETRKASILHKAFTGELTKKWREENGVGDDSWVEKTISDICIPRAGFAFDSKKFTTSGYQVIRMGNLYAGEVDLMRSPVFYSESDINQTILDRSLIRDGDILITLTGTKYKQDYGYAVIFRNPDKLLVNQRILCLRPTDTVKESFILYYLKSKIFRDIFFSNETGGVNQGNVSSKFVESIPVQVPTLSEQTEIVRILDIILEKEKQASEAALAVLEQIDLLKKSILTRAFRGKL